MSVNLPQVDEESKKDLDILVFGKTGNGKSESANCILGKPAFESSDGTSSVTSKIDIDFAEYKDGVLTVVDCPGFGDTRLDSKEHVEEFARWMTEAMKANGGKGYDACIIVLKYGSRYTEEERQPMIAMKRVFGEDFLRKHCILLMTHGDIFDRNKEGLTFEQWCNKQKDQFSELLKECDGRIVIVDNRTTDRKKQIAQREKLLEKIAHLPSGRERLTNILFSLASEEVAENLGAAGEPQNSKFIISRVSLLLDTYEECKQFEDNEENTPIYQIRSWKRLLQRSDARFEDSSQQGSSFKEQVDTLAKAVNEFINAKANRCPEIHRKYQEVIDAGNSLRKAYNSRKALYIAIAVGTTASLCATAAFLPSMIVTVVCRIPSTSAILSGIEPVLLSILQKTCPRPALCVHLLKFLLQKWKEINSLAELSIDMLLQSIKIDNLVQFKAHPLLHAMQLMSTKPATIIGHLQLWWYRRNAL